MRRLPLALALVFLAACRSPDPNWLPQEQRVAVRDFEVAEGVEVQDYDHVKLPSDGATVAKWVVTRLKGRQRQAEAVAPGIPADADLIVTGRIVRAEGGSAGLRSLRIAMLVTFWPVGLAMRGAGNSELAVSGEVRRPDGSVVGQFDLEREGGGVEGAAQRVGVAVADMIFANRYEQTLARRPPIVTTTPATPSPPPKASASQRLEELDALRARDMITDDEYQRKRTQILNEL